MAGPLLSLGVALLLALACSAGVAISLQATSSRPGRFAEAELFLELNDTDGDLGIHGSIDGGPWTYLTIDAPGDRTLLEVLSRGQMRSQGLTQLMFESAEPPFDELSPEEFFQRFPEGRYEISGRLQDGGEMESSAILSHVLAAPPQNVTVSGLAAAMDCDAILPVVSAPVTLRWDPVTASHPELGRQGTIKVSRYQLFVEREGAELGLDLPPSVTEFEIPTSVTAPGGEFKFEIVVRAATGNNTAIESCFVVQ